MVLALLCGLGGGNFASSMSNISFFYPKSRKGYALGMNAGLGNLGVSLVQFVVPLVITTGVFGVLGGEPVMVDRSGQQVPMWLQNAGFIWVPFIMASALAAWFGMNDLKDAKASFADQAVIFKRKHNWLMCWLYIGTFGSFIGYSAGFPLLIKSQFPEINALSYAWLGPLVGALIPTVAAWRGTRSDPRGGPPSSIGNGAPDSGQGLVGADRQHPGLYRVLHGVDDVWRHRHPAEEGAQSQRPGRGSRRSPRRAWCTLSTAPT